MGGLGAAGGHRDGCFKPLQVEFTCCCRAADLPEDSEEEGEHGEAKKAKQQRAHPALQDAGQQKVAEVQPQKQRQQPLVAHEPLQQQQQQQQQGGGAQCSHAKALCEADTSKGFLLCGMLAGSENEEVIAVATPIGSMVGNGS